MLEMRFDEKKGLWAEGEDAGFRGRDASRNPS